MILHEPKMTSIACINSSTVAPYATTASCLSVRIKRLLNSLPRIPICNNRNTTIKPKGIPNEFTNVTNAISLSGTGIAVKLTVFPNNPDIHKARFPWNNWKPAP